MFIDEWTKIAPKHWKRKKLKYVASLRSGESITAESIKDEGNFPVYGGNGLRGYTSDFTHDGEFVLVGRQGALCGNVNYAKNRFWASEHAIVVTRLGDDDLTWLGESLRYLDLNRLSQSAAQPGISAEEVGNLLLAVPPLDEQRAISTYLKRETARLDALVAAKQRVLDLLTEKRKAIVANAATRGLDPHVKLRDSGVPWLGQIPLHWSAMRVRHLISSLEQGWSPEAENREPTADEWGILKLNAVSQGLFDQAAAKTLPARMDARPDIEVHAGDVLITRANTPSLVGDACFVTDTRPKLLLCDLIYRLRVQPERVDPRFLVYFLTTAGRPHPEMTARGTSNSMVKLAQEHIKDWWTPLPPLDEQRAIVNHIARETAKLDAVRTATERTIALLKERRAALIAAAVTGQLDVGSSA